MRRIFALFLALFLLIFPVQAKSGTKYAALTFDDGPSGRITRALLEGLEQRNVHATFFLCGYRLADYGNEAALIRQKGHEVGLHGYSHDSMAKMDEGTLRRELEDTASLLPAGCPVSLMRPPGGAANETVKAVARDMNLSVLFWSVDPKDWATDDASLIFSRMVQDTEDGDVILLHDMDMSSVEAALALVDELKTQGYKFLTVSQLAMLRLTQLKPGESYEGFAPGG